MVYKYFDTPDGEDCFKKLAIVSKYGATVGLFASVIDVLAVSHPKGYGATVARFGYITLPIMGIAATFTTSTCLLTSLRNKDDQVNYIVAGVASGAMLGVWQKSFQVGTLAAIFFGLGAAIGKHMLLKGYLGYNPDLKQSFGDFWTIHYDLSLTKERPRSWVTEK